MKSNLLAMAVLALMSDNVEFRQERDFTSPEPVKKVIPRGCKEYHFTQSGNIVSNTCTYIFYSCIASSEKKAKEKYQKYFNLTNSKVK